MYVFYDISDRPVYVGKAAVIRDRVRNHYEKFWFKSPIVDHAAYIEIQDERLRTQIEQILIKFLKSNAVLTSITWSVNTRNARSRAKVALARERSRAVTGRSNGLRLMTAIARNPTKTERHSGRTCPP